MFKKIYQEDGSRVECARRNYNTFLDAESKNSAKNPVNKTTGQIEKKITTRLEINKINIRNSKARKGSVTGKTKHQLPKKERVNILSNSFNSPSLQFSLPIGGSHSEMASTPLPQAAAYATLEKDKVRDESPRSGLKEATKSVEKSRAQKKQS